MLKERHHVFVFLLAAIDLAFILAAQALTLQLGRFTGYLDAELAVSTATVGAYALSIPILMIAMLTVHLYRPRRDRAFFNEFIDILKAVCFGWGAFIITMQMIRHPFIQSDDAGYVIIAYPMSLIVCLTFHRWGFRSALRRIRERGWNLRHYAVVGTGRLGQIAFHTFLRNSWTGINCAYFVSHHDTTRRKECLNRPVAGGLDDLERIVDERPIDGVILALPNSRTYLLPKIMMRLERFAVEVRIIPDVSPRYMTINLDVHEIDGMPVLTMRQRPLNGFPAMAKRAIDLVLAVLALVVFALPMGLIALLIKLESGGPVIFEQARASIGSKPFRIYKFRTMHANATDEKREVGDSPAGAAQNGTEAWTKRNDPRITRLGRFLRRTSLDELPQLVNVIRGDMSLVGPRPERLDLIEDFRKDWRGYMLRQNIKPGMTGWAQINGLRGDTSLRKRLQYDLYYIRNWSLGFDLRILLLTLLRGFRHPNAH